MKNRIWIILTLLFWMQVGLAEDHDSSNEEKSPRETAEPKKLDESNVKEWASKFLGETFSLRKTRATHHASYILNAIEKNEEAEAIQDILSLTTSLDWEDKQKTLDSVNEERKEASGEKRKLLDRLAWVLEEVLNKEPGKSSTEQAFKSKVKDLEGAAENIAKKFQDDLDKAVEGDEAAKASLLKTYKPEALMDYLAQHKDDETGAKLSKLLGWQDKNGVNYLDVATDKEGKIENETWTLGKTDEEIGRSLKAFDSQIAGVPASTKDRILHTTLNTDPTRLKDRKFVKVGPENGQLVAHDPKVLSPEDQKEICKPTDPALVKSQAAEHRPFYFFRPFPFSDTASYSSLVNNKNRNFIKDMKTGKEKGVPGAWDPVPTPDELYMTIPTTDTSSKTQGIEIYAMKDLIGDNPNPVPLYEEDGEKNPSQKALTGVYQSIGITGQDMVSNTYRIITDGNGLSFRDYRIYSLQDGAGKVEALGDGPKRLCPEAGDNISLPMISKDGKFVSFLDTKDQMTKIFEIGDKGDRCTLVGNLGFASSKVDFGYDSENPVVVFHKFSHEPKRDNHIEVPSDELVANVYQFNLKTREISRLTNNKNENSIYPAFKRDGTVVYLHHPHGAGESDEGPKSKFVVVDPKKVSQVRVNLEDKALAAVGGLWAELCSPHADKFSPESLALSTLGIAPDSCKKMITKYGTIVQRFSEAELLAACPTPVKKVEVSGEGTNSGVARPAAPVPSKCLSCHLTKIPWDNRDLLNKPNQTARGMSFLDDIESRINEPLKDAEGNTNRLHMPLNEELSPEDRQMLVDWISSQR